MSAAEERERLEDQRRVWARKPGLALVYAVWFDALLAEVPRGATVLEVGAGPGFLAAHARRQRPDLRWLALDVLPAPWNDLAGDALALPLRGSCVQAVVALDVLHHLARPERFFREAARVLAPGGRLALVEPWVSPLSYPIYRFLHQEGLRPGLDPWHPFELGPGKAAFEGDGGLVTRLLRTTPESRWRELGFEPPRVRRLNCFAYLLSLGFKPRSLLPRAAAPALLAFDRWSEPLARVLALRALLVWPWAVV